MNGRTESVPCKADAWPNFQLGKRTLDFLLNIQLGNYLNPAITFGSLNFLYILNIQSNIKFTLSTTFEFIQSFGQTSYRQRMRGGGVTRKYIHLFME